MPRDARIAAMMSVADPGPDDYLIMLTRQGMIKRTPLAAFATVRGTLTAIKLRVSASLFLHARLLFHSACREYAMERSSCGAWHALWRIHNMESNRLIAWHPMERLDGVNAGACVCARRRAMS